MNLKLLVVFALFAIIFNANAQTDRYWSGGSSWSDNLSEASNWFGAINPNSGDNLYFNNTTGFRHFVYSNYSTGSYFSNFITYNGAGGIKLYGDNTYALKFENHNDGNLLELSPSSALPGNREIGNRIDYDLEINPVGSGGILVSCDKISLDNLNGTRSLKIYGTKTLTINSVIYEQNGSGSTLQLLNAATVDLKGNSSFTGLTTVKAGILKLNASGGALKSGNAVSINGGTLHVMQSQTLGNLTLTSGTLQVDSGVTLTITGNYTATGGTIDNKGTIKFAGGPVIFPGNASVNNGMANTLVGFEVASPATVKLDSSFSVAEAFIVSAGGILDFNGFELLGSGNFTLASTGTLKITSADGVNVAGNTGNIRCSGTRVFSQTGYYHYVGGSSPQSTGTAMTSGSTAKQIVINKTNATDIVNLTQSTGTTGFLQISKGIFVESATSGVNGSGDLTIDTEGTYKIAITGNTVPQISGTYTLSGNSTLELNGSGAQELRGSKSYRNLVFSNSGTKFLSSAITNANTITGTVTIKDAAILDVDNKSFGGSGTNLTMTGTSELITAGTGVKPDISGIYTLGSGTKITFTNVASTLESIRLAPDYYNIDVVGSSVGTNTLASAVKIQNGGTFTVKSTGTFKHSNTTGFTGGTDTAIGNVNNPTITLEEGSTIEYAGDNQSITLLPATTTYSNLTVSGTGTKTIPTELFIGNDLLVKASTLKIESGKTLTVTNKVFVDPAATMTIESNLTSQSGSLVQINNTDTNSGSITYNRIVPIINSTDYTYWSSPVSGQNLQAFSPNTPSNKFYSFNASAVPENWQNVVPSSVSMGKGVGYCIYGPQLATPPAFFQAIFNGVPNNGTIETPVVFNGAVDGTSNLIGNPYPSAIDADKFLDFNKTVIDGTLYFWTHNTARDANGQYNVNDYAVYNLTGGVVIDGVTYAKGGTTAPSDPLYPSGKIPNGKIAAGQAFFTTCIASGNVVFNNNMRLDKDSKVMDNSQFFKTRSPKSKTEVVEKHRIWLDLTNTQGVFKQTLVGYISGATNQFDNRFDGISFDGNEFADFYSLSQDKNLVIQGRALPFDENDEVLLGFRTSIEGAFTIKIDQIDGVLINQAVFIEDKLTNTTFDLRTGPFTFNTAAGTFNDRFVLRYTNKTLGTIDLETGDNQVLVSNKNKQIKVNSKAETIDKVTVYDLLGRQLFKKDKVNSNELTILNLVSSQQTLLLKVILQNGQTVTKKIIY
jgi:autotransporter-associated beta strand protein